MRELQKVATVMVGQGRTETILACAAVLSRLAVAIAEENRALVSREGRLYTDFAYCKNQLLRELMAAQRHCRDQAAMAELAPQYSQLRELLSRNEILLKVNMDAMQDVSTVIVDCIKQMESDGTYSRRSSESVNW